MEVSELSTSPRKKIWNDRGAGIQAYGENNDYPQKIKEVIDASGVGTACKNRYIDFVTGKGFEDVNLAEAVINADGLTADELLNSICKDFCTYNGFALHLNYNANYQVTEIQYVPFEHVRFQKMDEEGNFNMVALHWDWGKRMSALRRWRKDDIDFIHFFNPDPKAIRDQVRESGGWSQYKGQVFYFSAAGPKTYPIAIFDAVTPEMSTDESVMTIKNRDSKNGFLGATLLYQVANRTQSDQQQNEMQRIIRQIYGDENSFKVIVGQVETPEQLPVILPIDRDSKAPEYEYTEKSLNINIGRVFNQPPILRCDDVGNNFGANAIRNSYDYYNSVTANIRLTIESQMKKVLSLLLGDNIDTKIESLSYEYNSVDISEVPQEVLRCMTINEIRGMMGLKPIEEIDDNSGLFKAQQTTEVKDVNNGG